MPQWWGEVEDLNLMIGALKHGHKDFPKIRSGMFYLLLKSYYLDSQKSVCFLLGTDGGVCVWYVKRGMGCGQV